METLDHFLLRMETGENLCGVSTDGAIAMLGSTSRFQSLTQRKTTNVLFIHCFIHSEALTSQTLPSGLQDVLML